MSGNITCPWAQSPPAGSRSGHQCKDTLPPALPGGNVRFTRISCCTWFSLFEIRQHNQISIAIIFKKFEDSKGKL